jgi:hypothetical protein
MYPAFLRKNPPVFYRKKFEIGQKSRFSLSRGLESGGTVFI